MHCSLADVDGLITQALLTGNFESAVDLCLHDNRMADAIILAIAGGQELLSRTQEKYFSKIQSKITRVCISAKNQHARRLLATSLSPFKFSRHSIGKLTHVQVFHTISEHKYLSCFNTVYW